MATKFKSVARGGIDRRVILRSDGTGTKKRRTRCDYGTMLWSGHGPGSMEFPQFYCPSQPEALATEGRALDPAFCFPASHCPGKRTRCIARRDFEGRGPSAAGRPHLTVQARADGAGSNSAESA